VKKSLVTKALLAVALATPLMASAESQLSTSGPAAAKLNFRVIIPRVLFLGVGTGATATPWATNATVDNAIFDFTTNAAAVGTGAAAGAISGNVVDVRLFGNNGQITLTATNAANLTNGSGDTIPFTQFTRSSSNTGLAVPAFSGGTTSPSLVAVGSKITDLTAQWTFAYSNTVNAAPGTYNGEVTYTASMP
jgi:hypothetical protein